MPKKRFAHKLKPNKSKTFPRYIVFFDVETKQQELDKRYIRQEFYLAVACYCKVKSGDFSFRKEWACFTNIEDLWDWIEARESRAKPWGFFSLLPGLYDYSTAANIYCYLLSSLGWASREVLGLKGLLLVFDEAETVEMNFYSQQAQNSRNFLRSLIL